MKNVVAKIGLLAVITIIAASASTQAQTLSYRLTANIPFDFSVSGKKLPAGKYWINRAQQSSGDMVVQISSPDGHSNIISFDDSCRRVEPCENRLAGVSPLWRGVLPF